MCVEVKGNLAGFSFHLVGSMDQTQAIRFGCKHIYLLTESFFWPIYLYVVTKKVFYFCLQELWQIWRPCYL